MIGKSYSLQKWNLIFLPRFPFVRSEFKKHDPDSFALMESIWGPRRSGLEFEKEKENGNLGVANLVQALLQ
jgi:hypothetical protein